MATYRNAFSVFRPEMRPKEREASRKKDFCFLDLDTGRIHAADSSATSFSNRAEDFSNAAAQFSSASLAFASSSARND